MANSEDNFETELAPPRSTFRQQVNPLTGLAVWVSSDNSDDEDEKTAQDVARSQYGDMLHDTERNVLYHRAINYAVTDVCRKFSSSSKDSTGDADKEHVHILDIGAGTGLLSMMAAQHARQEHANVPMKVTAFEAYEPMARIAEKCVKANKFDDCIKLIDRRSTTSVSGNGDLSQRAQLLVTEIYDSELIGEGGLDTIYHAFKHMLKPDAAVVPASALCYVQLISSEWLSSCQTFSGVASQWKKHCKTPLTLPDAMATCRGIPCGYDLHVERLWDTDDITLLSDPVLVQTFEMDSMEDLEQYCNRPQCVSKMVEIAAACNKSGPVSNTKSPCHGLVFWWDLLMHRGTDIVLSMSPSWRRDGKEKPQWREHWMPVVYLLPEALEVNQGDRLAVNFDHDNYSVWFDIVKPNNLRGASAPAHVERPICHCLAHVTWSREKCSDVNNADKFSSWANTLSKVPATIKTCLYLGSPSFLPLLCASLHPQVTVYAANITPSIATGNFMSELISTNNLTGRVHWLKKTAAELTPSDVDGKQVDMLLAEPFFSTSILPWHDLAFMYLRSSLSSLLSKDCVVLPRGASVMAAPVHFTDFWKMRASVGTVCGFDLSEFDIFTETTPALDKDGRVSYDDAESFGVWEYESYLLAQPQAIMSFDFTQRLDASVTQRGSATFKTNSTKPSNAVVFWMDVSLSDDTVLTNGISQAVALVSDDIEPAWDRGLRQGVVFITGAMRSDETARGSRQCEEFLVSAELLPTTGQFNVSVK